MVRLSSIGTIAVLAALSATGGFVGAEALFGNGQKAAGLPNVRPGDATTVLIPPPQPPIENEIHDAHYGFRFQYPPGWIAGPRNDASVVASVGGPDGVYCYVSVRAQTLSTDAKGRPHNLAALLDAVTPSALLGAFSGVPTTVESFVKADWGDQEARGFVFSAEVPIAGTLKLEGRATLRGSGAVVLTCVAPARRHNDADVRAAFAKVRESFKFEQP